MEDCVVYNSCNHKDCDKDFCLRQYKINSLYDSACLPQMYRKRIKLMVDSDGTDLEQFQRLSEFEKNIEKFVTDGCNLFIHSTQCGNGKSSWAIRLLQDYLDSIWHKSELKCRALYIDVPMLLNGLKENLSTKSDYISYIKENIYDADLVIWDEIGEKVGTEFELNQLLSFINGRISNKKSNIYTSNLTAQKMYTYLGERLTSRIVNYSGDVELFGKDKRAIKQGGNN